MAQHKKKGGQARRKKAEFGDFQTPAELAAEVCRVVVDRLPRPRAVVEPTCGLGNFLAAGQAQFEGVRAWVGVETNAEYVQRTRERFAAQSSDAVELIHEDFFRLDWHALMERLPSPVLVLGNPPWVTVAELGVLGSANLPLKSNFQGHKGLDAMTGKSNFDISEWMCIRLLEILADKQASFALLVKTAVARKVLLHAWKHALPLRRPCIRGIDAKRHFGAAVDACLFTGQVEHSKVRSCPVYAELGASKRTGMIGYEDGKLVADIESRRRTAKLSASSADQPKWRSGVKHDCAKVLELRPQGEGLQNGLGELVDVEPEFLYPLQKSSDVAGARGDGGKRLIVTQRSVGATTEGLELAAPRLWAYLQAHGAALDARKSSIYRGKPRFSIFGVGPYTFAPWKIAISGLYKRLEFSLQGPVDGRPVVFDDTVYFLPFETEVQARRAYGWLGSALAQDFYRSFIFWDAKRPVTAGLLRRLSLEKLCEALGGPPLAKRELQGSLFE